MLLLLSIGVKVTYNGRGVTKLKHALRMRGLVPEFRAAFNDIDKIYRAFLRDRFVQFSRGGGNWRRLAAATLARRRNKGTASILRDTGAMFASFQPSIVKTTGIVKKASKIGFNVTFGRPMPHYSGATTTELMRWHHTGSGRLPARKLVVGMDNKTAKRAAMRLELAMQQIARKRK